MTLAKKFIYAKEFEGLPKVDDFMLEEETLPEVNDGEILVEAVYLSVDPYMRIYIKAYPVGITMIGGQIAKVLKSKNDDFPEDCYIYAWIGWRTHTVFNPKDSETHIIRPYVLPPFDDLSLSLGLGNIGPTGASAYFGLLDICDPKEGEVVVVSGAAGAVGSVAGQIAKIIGCKVIGIAGSDEKCEWITTELGFDHAINYKTESVDEMLKEYASDGIDCYFDNVGGEISSTVINQMRDFGRISVCGFISAYNLSDSELPSVPILQPAFLYKRLTMKGFTVNTYWDKWFECLTQLNQWTDEGKLKYRETVTDGFENMPQALIDMLQGENIGKAVVKA